MQIYRSPRFFFNETGRILSLCPSRFRFRTSPYCLMVVLLPSWGKISVEPWTSLVISAFLVFRLAFLWNQKHHCVWINQYLNDHFPDAHNCSWFSLNHEQLWASGKCQITIIIYTWNCFACQKLQLFSKAMKLKANFARYIAMATLTALIAQQWKPKASFFIFKLS